MRAGKADDLSKMGFDILGVAFGVVLGAVWATISFFAAFWAGALFAVVGIAIITYTWPRHSPDSLQGGPDNE